MVQLLLINNQIFDSSVKIYCYEDQLLKKRMDSSSESFILNDFN